MKIGIVAAIYLTNDEHRRLLWQMRDSISCSEEIETIAVINHVERLDDLMEVNWRFLNVMVNDQNCLARAWNMGIRRALFRGCDYILVTNTDIVFRKDTIAELIKFAKKHPEAYAWCPTFFQQDQGINPEQIESFQPTDTCLDSSYFSCFLIDKRLPTEFGEFDEQFSPIYYEDIDMEYRVRLRGGKFLTTGNAIVWHYGSHSWKTSKDINQTDGDVIYDKSIENYNRYVAKWGGAPGAEQWTIPYNGEQK